MEAHFQADERTEENCQSKRAEPIHVSGITYGKRR
jgi:hypothetical protein